MSRNHSPKLDLNQEIKIQNTHLIQTIKGLAGLDLCQEITAPNLI
jgi:hypothetical protein